MVDWFVIYNNEHLGPFSEGVLKQLFVEGDITKETLVWQEGMEEPVTYENQFLYEKDQLLFKTLDKVAPKVEASSVHKVEQEMEEDELPPALPPEVIHPPTPIKAKVSKNVSVAPVVLKQDPVTPRLKEHKEEEKEVPKKKLSTKKAPAQVSSPELLPKIAKGKKSKVSEGFFLKFAMAAIILIIIVPGVFYFKTTFVGFSRPHQMSMSDYERLKTISIDPSFENKFAIGNSADFSKIWLVSNLPYEGEVVLKITSIKEKTLTSSEVEATSKGYLKNKIVEFNQWTFTKGSKIVDGYYNIEAYTLKDLTIPTTMRLYPKRKNQFRFFDEILISQLTKDQFNSTLNQTKTQLNQNDMAFWEELKQKYQTIKMITVQIQTEINRALKSENVYWVEELKKFETKYKNEFGTFFTNFVIQNDQSYEDLKKQDFTNKLEIISNYTRLSQLAREVGKASMDIFHEMEVFDGIDDAAKERLQKMSDERFNMIIKACDDKIAMIQTF